MSLKKVAVIGGGAAGMMTAIFAARSGYEVTVFEKNRKIGRKIYITGKGRCNLTNNCDIRTVIANTPTNGRFLYSALDHFSPEDTIAFFEANGLPLKTERGNRVFPVSDRAGDVVDTLLKVSRQAGCKIINETVTGLEIKDGSVFGVVHSGKTTPFDKIIVACGGASYPLTGSTGDGYAFARAAGHTVTPLKPSLVPLETVEKIEPEADKLLLKNVSLNIFDTVKGKSIYTDFGELQMMSYGVSGAVVLSASSHIRDMQVQRYRIIIDLKPALSAEKLDARLQREISLHKGRPCCEMMRTLLPSALTDTFYRIAGIPYQTNCSELTKLQRRDIVKGLKEFTLTVKGFRPIEEAIVTSGGVCVKEINPATMQSKLVKGLYFAGEVIDYDCYTGGFNLQCAFSTGALAGECRE